MKISVFGLGYVGTVAAACLADDGHTVVGVDPNEGKLALVADGKAPLVEPGVGDLIEQAVNEGRLTATASACDAVMNSELSIVCVGTPARENGQPYLDFLQTVCTEIGSAIGNKEDFHTVVIRSTILPGTMHEELIPILEASSNKKAGQDFGVAHNPEFLREGTAVFDYRNPPKTVIGEMNERSGDAVYEIYQDISGPVLRVPIEVAEMVKFADNTWHAVKVCFANEIGNICKSAGIDSHAVMDIFCQDTKLNLSPYYLKPGFAFGGSCLPKDVRALNYRARSLDLRLPLMESIMPSNAEQVERALRIILRSECKRIGILGFSFKANTDDLRESPIVEIIERLLGKGFDLQLYDKNVNLARLTGSNKEFINSQIPHISALMVDDLESLVADSELIIVGNQSEEFACAVEKKKPGTKVLDLVRISEEYDQWTDYDGICW
ncbi:MAG: nucleotide sugar dehydrogenase [Pseudomonadota bacterium]